MVKNLELLSDLELHYLRMNVLRAHFKRRKMDYMISVIFGE